MFCKKIQIRINRYKEPLFPLDKLSHYYCSRFALSRGKSKSINQNGNSETLSPVNKQLLCLDVQFPRLEYYKNVLTHFSWCPKPMYRQLYIANHSVFLILFSSSFFWCYPCLNLDRCYSIYFRLTIKLWKWRQKCNCP